MHCDTFSASVSALIMTTGMSRLSGSLLITLSTSSPFKSGIIKSSRTRLNFSFWISAIASFPPAALEIRSWPSLSSSNCSVYRLSSLSSTMRMPGSSVAMRTSRSSCSANHVGGRWAADGGVLIIASAAPASRACLHRMNRAASVRSCSLRRSRGQSINRPLAKIAVDVERLAVQRARPREISGEEPSGGERAQAARQRLRGPERLQQRVRLVQQVFSLIGAVGQQPRSAGPQQYPAFVKAVTQIAIEVGGAHGLLVIGGIVELPHVAGLPREEPRRDVRRRRLVGLLERRRDPAPVLRDQA